MRSWINNFALGLARLWPIGLSPRAPGTAASAVAALAAPWLFLPLSWPWRVLELTLIFGVGVWASGKAEKMLGIPDPSSVVVDELVGQWIVLFPLALGFTGPFVGPLIGPQGSQVHILALLLGFGLFRLFDIWKPGPVRASESWLPGGGGIMIDDVVAGLMGLVGMLAVFGISALFS